MSTILEILQDIRPDSDFSSSSDFVEDGLLDSFDIVMISSQIEEDYGIKIDGLDILPENFNSVDAIIALIRKSGGQI